MKAPLVKIICATVIIIAVILVHALCPGINGGLDIWAGAAVGFLFGSGVKAAS